MAAVLLEAAALKRAELRRFHPAPHCTAPQGAPSAVEHSYAAALLLRCHRYRLAQKTVCLCRPDKPPALRYTALRPIRHLRPNRTVLRAETLAPRLDHMSIAYLRRARLLTALLLLLTAPLTMTRRGKRARTAAAPRPCSDDEACSASDGEWKDATRNADYIKRPCTATKKKPRKSGGSAVYD